MKKKKTTKKVSFPKYEYGSFVEDPSTALYQNQINKVKAETSANSPLSTGLDIFGGIASQVGSIMMQKGLANGDGADGKGVAGFLNKNGNMINGGLGILGALSQFETGGISKGTPINAEGQEVIETPDGTVQELNGPSHAEGGIDMVVPEGTEIYSKKLKGPDGKSMAERKKIRERQLSKLEKLVSQNPTDKIAKKTLEKTKVDYAKQEQEDMQKMQVMHQMTQMMSAMEHFATGGIAGNPYPPFDFSKLFTGVPKFSGTSTDYHADGLLPGEIAGIPTDKVLSTPTDGTITLTDDELEDTSFENTMPELNAGNSVRNMKGYYNKEELGDLGAYPDKENNPLEDIFGKSETGTGLSLGDMTGLFGQLYSTFKPMQNTKENRAGDTPNVNSFKDYGKDGLKALDKSKEFARQVRDEQNKDIELSKASAIKRGRNSARGINTMRALDLSSEANANNAKSQINNQFLQVMQQILGQEASLENDQDSKVMQGEASKDMNDRRDRDAYYSQLAQDIATKGTGIQFIGKTMNDVKERNVTGKVMNTLFPNFKMNGLTGEMKKVASNEISEGQTFYASIPDVKTREEVLKNVSSGTWVRKGNKVYDKTTGKEINLNSTT